MAAYNTGEILRRLRTERGYTQAKLCEGICSISTLSRAENGEFNLREPGFFHILQRLGIANGELLYSLFVSEGYEDFELRNEIVHCMAREDYVEANELLKRQRSKNAGDGALTQLTMCLEASIAFNTDSSEVNFADLRAKLIEALRLTSPNVSLSALETSAFTNDEAVIVSGIAGSYMVEGQYHEAIEIFTALQLYFEKCHKDTCEYSGTYTVVLYNLSKALGLAGRNKECIDVCDKGINVCRIAPKHFCLAGLLFNKAYALHMLNSTEPYTHLLTQSYYIYDAMGRRTLRDMVRKFAKSEFDFDIPGIWY